MFFQNITSISDWIDLFVQIYQHSHLNLQKFIREESDDLSGHNHDEHYRYRRSELRRMHWYISLLSWICNQIKPHISGNSYDLLFDYINQLSFKRYSLLVKLHNQWKKVRCRHLPISVNYTF